MSMTKILICALMIASAAPAFADEAKKWTLGMDDEVGIAPAEVKAAKEKRESDPKRAAYHACNAKEGIAKTKELIARENRIAKASGTKNLTVLNNLGSMQINDEDVLDRESAHYKVLTGKALDFSICKDLPEFDD